MPTAETTPFGSWRSPITIDVLVADAVRLGGIACDGDDAYWLEGRPGEGGRNVLVHCDAHGAARDVTPAPYNVRTRVHEYGGGAYVVRKGHVWFANDADQRIYSQSRGAAPVALTPEGRWRYADLQIDERRRRLVCVREDHTGEGEPRNELVAVGLDDGAVTVLATGHDFFAAPRLDAPGEQLAWITWDHPDMPWDATELWVARLDGDGRPAEPRRIAGGRSCAVCHPAWSAQGSLFFVADPDGWWNLHAWDGAGVRCVVAGAEEHGLPMWQFGTSTYGFLRDDRILLAACRRGLWRLRLVHTDGGGVDDVAFPHDAIDAVVAGNGAALVLAGSATRTSAVMRLEPDRGTQTVLKASSELPCTEEYISHPESLHYPTSRGQEAHAFYYAPASPAHRGPPGTHPPLIVMGHGGPTGATSTMLKPAVQFWTSRGITVCDVNYRGSVGYGRGYRSLLDGEWGVADVADCANAARYLSSTGRADPRHMAIRGGSAGGYTALAALAFHDTFAAGASYYGISELEALARDTHKFESRYLDRLIGPYPEKRDLYRARSPINHVERLSCPVIFFQGLEDAVVPPNQAEMMVEALREKGLPVAYLAFEGEQHGFRRAETIARAHEAELYFYGRIFGFHPADAIEPVSIWNL